MTYQIIVNEHSEQIHLRKSHPLYNQIIIQFPLKQNYFILFVYKCYTNRLFTWLEYREPPVPLWCVLFGVITRTVSQVNDNMTPFKNQTE